MRGKAWLVALVLIGALTTGAGLRAQVTPVRSPVYQVVVDVDPVSIDVAVTDRQGRSVTNLTREDFIVYEDGQPQMLRNADVVACPTAFLSWSIGARAKTRATGQNSSSNPLICF